MKTSSELPVPKVSPFALSAIHIPRFISSKFSIGDEHSADGECILRRLKRVCSMLEDIWLVCFVLDFAVLTVGLYLDPSVGFVVALGLLPFALIPILRYLVLPCFSVWGDAVHYCEVLQFLACTLELKTVNDLCCVKTWEEVRLQVLRQRRKCDPEIREAMSSVTDEVKVSPFAHAVTQTVEALDLKGELCGLQAV